MVREEHDRIDGLATQQNSAENVNIGRRAGATGFEYAGLIDDVRIYGRAQSATEIQADMNTPVGVVVDTIPPIISAVSSNSLSPTGATITWVTNEAADSQVEYGLTASYGSSTMLDPSLVTSHSVTLSGLADNTTYHYRVKSKDAAGNPATSADATFTVASVRKRRGQLTSQD